MNTLAEDAALEAVHMIRAAVAGLDLDALPAIWDASGHDITPQLRDAIALAVDAAEADDEYHNASP
jgi:hypothetical protein